MLLKSFTVIYRGEAGLDEYLEHKTVTIKVIQVTYLLCVSLQFITPVHVIAIYNTCACHCNL